MTTASWSGITSANWCIFSDTPRGPQSCAAAEVPLPASSRQAIGTPTFLAIFFTVESVTPGGGVNGHRNPDVAASNESDA